VQFHSRRRMGEQTCEVSMSVCLLQLLPVISVERRHTGHNGICVLEPHFHFQRQSSQTSRSPKMCWAFQKTHILALFIYSFQVLRFCL
jgi:hypothetical protein